MEEAFALFSAADEGRFWLLEGHRSRGMTPLCVSTANDVLWGTQYGANLCRLPPTKGRQAARFSGVHAHARDSPCCSEWEVMERAAPVENLVGPTVISSPATWQARPEPITAALPFEEADLASMSTAGLRCIPAVCATGAATKLFRTGDLVEADGTAGVVRILERA